MHQEHGYSCQPPNPTPQKEPILEHTGLQWNSKYYELDLPAADLDSLIDAVHVGELEAILDAVANSEVLFTGMKRKVLEELHVEASDLCTLQNPSILRSLRDISQLQSTASTFTELCGTEMGKR